MRTSFTPWILKTFGLIIGDFGRRHIGRRARELVADRPELEGLVDSMLAVRGTVVAQITELDRMIRQLSKEGDTIRRSIWKDGTEFRWEKEAAMA